MATSLVASSTAAGSANVTVVAGTPATIFLNSGSAASLPQDAKALIEIQNAGAVFSYVGELSQAKPSTSITSPGVYRVSKSTSGTAYGIDQG